MSTMFPEQQAAEHRAQRHDRVIRMCVIAGVTFIAIVLIVLTPNCVAMPG